LLQLPVQLLVEFPLFPLLRCFVMLWHCSISALALGDRPSVTEDSWRQSERN
jgi:hypothetical protein